jgi:hypothetical protein
MPDEVITEQPADEDTEQVSNPEPEQPIESATDETGEETTDSNDEPDTFPRSYVEDLRKENKNYRERAKRGEEFAQRLHTELVRATGRLADPSDLAFNESHLEDADAISAAIDDLLAKKPHLASRRVSGEIGQGATPSTSTVDLAGLLRRRAG